MVSYNFGKYIHNAYKKQIQLAIDKNIHVQVNYTVTYLLISIHFSV